MLKGVFQPRPDIPPIVFIGMTDDNITRLQDGKPLVVDLAELGLPATVVSIFTGRDHNDLTRQLREAGLPVNDQGSPEPNQTFWQRP